MAPLTFDTGALPDRTALVAVPDFPHHFVCTDGHVYCDAHFVVGLRRLRPRLHREGYLQVTLHHGTLVRHPLVHRLIAQAFLPADPARPFVNHRNGVKTDNRVLNLEWVTMVENNCHSRSALGHSTRGAKNPMAKALPPKVIADILQLRAQGFAMKSIANKMGLSFTVARTIINGTHWQVR